MVLKSDELNFTTNVFNRLSNGVKGLNTYRHHCGF